MSSRASSSLKKLWSYGDGYQNPIARMRIRNSRLLLRHTLWAGLVLSGLQSACIINLLLVHPGLLGVLANLSRSGVLIMLALPVIVSLAAFFQTQRFAETEVFDLLRLTHLEDAQIFYGVSFTILHYTRDLLLVPLSILPLLAFGSMILDFRFKASRLLSSPALLPIHVPTFPVGDVLHVGYVSVVWCIAMWALYLWGVGLGVALGFRLKSAAGGAGIIASAFVVLYAGYVAGILLLDAPMLVTLVFCGVCWGLLMYGGWFGLRSV